MSEQHKTDKEVIEKKPRRKERRIRRLRPLVNKEDSESQQPPLTDEEILLDGSGDEDFLPFARQFRNRPDRFFGDFKFITRLSARRARRRLQITDAEHQQILSLIRNPVRVCKETGQPISVWGQFDRRVRAQMPKELAVVKQSDWSTIWRRIVEWFKENWPTILKIALTILALI